ncbi:hypothetical protein GGX14DRAFT_408347 [Mycena pura]|uniref:Fungal N-terminal domain-containing protein n=1 Tax=Mycena pura TaxID=153505 RepID=A0AAD6XW25_9AGAR|nr:hypothetical protein GGX14DRAFT_408347 [Mycena pura]
MIDHPATLQMSTILQLCRYTLNKSAKPQISSDNHKKASIIELISDLHRVFAGTSPTGNRMPVGSPGPNRSPFRPEMAFLSGLRRTKRSAQSDSIVNKMNMAGKAVEIAGGVGEMVPVGGSILKGISTTANVILQTIEAHYQNQKDLQEIGRRVRATELLVLELKELASKSGQQTTLGERYFETCRKFEELLRNMHGKIISDLASNTCGFAPYLRTKEINSLIGTSRLELDDIRIHWLATVSPDDEKDPYYKLKPADIRLEPDASAILGFSVVTITRHMCRAEKVLMRRFDNDKTSPGQSGTGNNAVAIQAFEHELAALGKINIGARNFRFLQIFGICRSSSLTAIVFNEGTNAFMTKLQYQRQHNLTGLDWVRHQLEVHLQHSDSAVDMVQSHGIVIEAYRPLDVLVRPNGQLVVTGFRGLHGSPRPSFLHDPLIRALSQSFESQSLAPIQWFTFAAACVHHFPFTFDLMESLPATTPMCACISLAGERLLGLACFTSNNPLAQRWAPNFEFQGSHVVQKIPYKTSSSILYCAYAPHFKVELREPRGISFTVSRKHTLAPDKLSLYAEPPKLDLQTGTLIWQPLQLSRDDGTSVDLERDFTVQYGVIYHRRHWDPRGIQALMELHHKYGVDPSARGQDIARKIGPKVGIVAFLANEVTWADYLHSNCTTPGGHLVGDDVFFQGLEDLGDVVGVQSQERIRFQASSSHNPRSVQSLLRTLPRLEGDDPAASMFLSLTDGFTGVSFSTVTVRSVSPTNGVGLVCEEFGDGPAAPKTTGGRSASDPDQPGRNRGKRMCWFIGKRERAVWERVGVTLIRHMY